KMIRHQNKSVQSIGSFGAVVQERFDKNLAWRRYMKNGAAFPGARGHEIRAWNARVSLWYGHPLSG
ncbi:MAG: hypothetical protein ACRD52_13910, partial [Candidatus Acidiferrales bacterium]